MEGPFIIILHSSFIIRDTRRASPDPIGRDAGVDVIVDHDHRREPRRRCSGSYRCEELILGGFRDDADCS